MGSRSFLSLSLLTALSLTAAAAHAQEPPPAAPGTYALTVALDDVVLPLLAAAETDAAQGRPGLAQARAQVVLETLPATSTLRVRAEGVRLVAQQALGATPVAPTAPEVLVEPLVVQAEQDTQRGSHALAIARLDFALARVPAGGELARRAQALRAAASQLLVQGQPAVVPTAPVGQPAVVAPYGGYAPVAPVADPELAAASAEPVAPVDPTRRGDAEAIELYITAAAYGVYLGFWIPFAAGLEGDDSSSGGSPENLGYSLSMLAGGGVMALLVAGLDSGEGLRTGVGPSISMGIRYGLGMGFLMWGALDPILSSTRLPSSDPTCSFCEGPENRGGWAERTALPMAFGLGGGLLGAVIGYGTSPSTDDVRFVETSGIWGTGLGLLCAIAAAEDSSQGFGITATGLGVGLLTTSIMAGAGVDVSARRGWLMTLGFAIGAGAGTIVPALAAAGTGDFDYRIFGAVAAVTSVAGLVTAFILTDGMDERMRERRAQEQRAGFDPMRDLRIGAGPTEGGGVFSLSGQF
ncbi:hypothetical protein [Sandaracinus amylolyticus]|uniref:hypothetical protein n=1 Tax=Sandaracinus amylolyticus TaxID=927083 RepID=UPI001F2ED6B2|nr:hypothetical protein [Sandaracinus amylolyticus]UJR78482.1 Hypothetical protein I5071_5120 [Sandaracinus amylolyticus]